MKKNFENKEKNSYKNAPTVCGKYTKAQKHILSVSVITSFITTFMGSALNLSIPAIEEEYSVSAAMVGWIITIYMLTCAALAVPFGKIGDFMVWHFNLYIIFCIGNLFRETVGAAFLSFFARGGRFYDIQYQHCYFGRQF